MRSILFIFWCLINLISFCQDCTIVSIKGNVTNENNVRLGKGMKIDLDQKIKFSSGSDAIAVICPNDGKVILTPKGPNDLETSEIKTVLGDLFIPQTKNAKTAQEYITRSDDAPVATTH